VLKAGDTAPEFDAPSSRGGNLKLSSLRGKRVVLFFYPKAFTTGCTIEARSFRDNYESLVAQGVEVVGVSMDPLDRQCDFANSEQLKYPLVADPDGKITAAFGVRWPLIKAAKRVTFVIDEKGVISGAFRHELQIGKHLDDVRKHLAQHA
jgi:peroxiredoxin Q/BCP